MWRAVIRRHEEDFVQTSALTLADAIFPRVSSDNRALAIARDVLLMAGGAALVTLFAQIVLRVPWTTVPITGQTFAVLVVGGSLGAWRGAGSLSLYALWGMIGVPVFAAGSGATSGVWDVHFILPWKGNEFLLWNASSGGYVVGFILAAALVGYLAEHRWDRGPWVHAGMLLGNAVLYLPGLLWLGYLIGTDWIPPGSAKPLGELIAGSDTLDKTLKGGLYPFIVGDLMKLLLAATILPSAWLIVERIGQRHRT
jgi:biotin transport system substrate-specific component